MYVWIYLVGGEIKKIKKRRNAHDGGCITHAGPNHEGLSRDTLNEKQAELSIVMSTSASDIIPLMSDEYSSFTFALT